MDLDLWRQWQTFAAMLSPTTAAASQTAGPGDAPAFAPFVDAAGRFTAAARRYFEGTAHASAPAAAEAARVFGESLRDQFADFSKLPWSTGFGGGTMRAPALGLTREHQQRWQRASEAWGRIGEAQRRLQRLWSDALRDAAAAFATRLGPLQSTVPNAETLDGLYDSWIDCAEKAYARTAHSEEFCNALAELMNASSQWRRALQTSIEQWAKLLDLPTRSEINTLTQRLKSIETELRATRAPDAERNKPKPRAAAVTGKARRGRRKSTT